MNKTWLDQKNYDKAANLYAQGVLGQIDADLAIAALTNEASFDAGFEAGVLASEAGVGRYSD